MKKTFISKRDIAGWAVMFAVFAVLYITGLHTEVIGQVQRAVLATGLIRPDVPEAVVTPPPSGTGITAGTTSAKEAGVAGSGFLMSTLDGKVVSFDSLKGKVVFLNIWATWCPPCVAEMPNIQSLYEKVNSNKIAFVMLSVDKAGAERVQKFIQRKSYTFPVYLPAGPFPEEFQNSAVPTTYIISPEGKIVVMQEGMADYDTEEMRDFLQKLASQG